MNNVSLSPRDYQAVIFDLDGVVTRTAAVHAAAWKQLFDTFLQHRDGASYRPFTETDYLDHVDGRPRYEGVAAFLASRGIRLPPGDPADPPGQDTVCGLGNRKNQLFRELLDTHGVEVFESTLGLVRELRRQGLKTAIVSSSQNAASVLAAAGIQDLFDTRVDGNDIPRLKLKGKPEPDLFLEAAIRLNLEPRQAVVVEDAVSGVKAGRAGGFGQVIGVDRAGRSQALKEAGAHAVVTDLAAVTVDGDPSEVQALPSALDVFETIAQRLEGRVPAVFLDYDGTLTPIVERPELAVLAETMRHKVRRLSTLCPVAVVSGRDLEDVRRLVGVKELIFAGSHGFDIAGPEDQCLGRQQGNEFLPALDVAEKLLKERLTGIDGALVERKKMAIAIHYRRVAEGDIPAIEQAVDAARAANPNLRKDYGKKIFELQPNMDWHKGRAVRWLLKALKLDNDSVLPMYLGDDVTDENAFKELRDDGIGIKVMDRPEPSAAHYALGDTDQVGLFFDKLIRLLEGRHG